MATAGQQNKPDDDLEYREDRGKAVTSAREPYSRTAWDLPPGEAPPTRGPGPTAKSSDEMGDYVESTTMVFTDEWLIQQAQENYTYSTNYLDANITNFWERNLAHFNNEHAPGTLYRRKDFKRSRVFRPKTRANVKKQEAALANAMFSTLNLVSVQAQNPTNPQSVLSAAINKEILQFRLEQKMPWFLTVQGAYQNTKVYGLCVSHQFWSYWEDKDLVPAFDDDGNLIYEEDPETGDRVMMGEERTVVREDRLGCDLIELENFRFDPMCDWKDPATSSPYLIMMKPIYAGEALEMMERKDPKTGKQQWRSYTLGEILGTRRQDYDRTRQAREGRDRIDPADEQHGNENTTLWAHMNIVKKDGEDWVYWTMGTELVLTEPVKLSEEYPWLEPGERPFVVGYSTVEAFRNYPSGDVEQSAPVQEEINQVANQRLDNVKLVLNKRYFVRRGSQVDLDALIRNVPGGGVMMNDPEKDVQTINTPDVTGSSYQEQGVLGQEFDDLVGGFNAQAAAQSGASVGGSAYASASAGAVQDYAIKIFVETWAERVLRQLLRLVQMYETDETILALASDKQAQAMQKYGQDEITDDLLTKGLILRVDVGMGNTDPMRRVERLIFGVTKAMEIPGMAMRVKGKQVTDEIFGAIGYRDSDRFFMTDEEFATYLEENPQGPSEQELKEMELNIRREDNQMRDERERAKIQEDSDNKEADRIARYEQTIEELQVRLRTAEMNDQTTRDAKAADVQQKTREMNTRQASGGAQ